MTRSRATAVPVSVPGGAPAETGQEQETDALDDGAAETEKDDGMPSDTLPSPLQRIADLLGVPPEEGEVFSAVANLQLRIAHLEHDSGPEYGQEKKAAAEAPASRPVLTEAGWVVPEPAPKA